MSSPLGRGLASLIPQDAAQSSDPNVVGERVVLLPIESVQPNPHQPRSRFDESALQELSASIVEHGILSPLLVTKEHDGYYLIAGERRLRAAKLANLQTIPCIIRNADEQSRLTQAIIENVQREDLNPIEAARAYKKLLEEHSLRQQDLSERVGKSRAAIANTLRLLQLPEPILYAVEEGRISEGHAKILLGLQPKEQEAYFQQIISNKLSVRALEQEVAATSVRQHVRTKKSPDVQAVEERLRNALGAGVSVGKSSVVIRFSSKDELDGIVRKILG